MFDNFDYRVIVDNLPYLFYTGMTFTLTLTVVATIGGIIIGALLAMMRVSQNPLLARFAELYVNIFRSLPLVLVIFWFYFLMPYVGQWITGASSPVRVGPYWSSIITFTLFEACYFCEIIRSGILSLSRGQLSAAEALGLTRRQAMQYVVLPQALRNMLPVMLTQTIILFQDTSLVYILSIQDFLGAAARIAQRDGRLLEMYVFVAVVYFAISFTASMFVRHLQKKIAVTR